MNRVKFVHVSCHYPEELLPAVEENFPQSVDESSFDIPHIFLAVVVATFHTVDESLLDDYLLQPRETPARRQIDGVQKSCGLLAARNFVRFDQLSHVVCGDESHKLTDQDSVLFFQLETVQEVIYELVVIVV